MHVCVNDSETVKLLFKNNSCNVCILVLTAVSHLLVKRDLEEVIVSVHKLK